MSLNLNLQKNRNISGFFILWLKTYFKFFFIKKSQLIVSVIATYAYLIAAYALTHN